MLIALEGSSLTQVSASASSFHITVAPLCDENVIIRPNDHTRDASAEPLCGILSHSPERAPSQL